MQSSVTCPPADNPTDSLKAGGIFCLWYNKGKERDTMNEHTQEQITKLESIAKTIFPVFKHFLVEPTHIVMRVGNIDFNMDGWQEIDTFLREKWNQLNQFNGWGDYPNPLGDLPFDAAKVEAARAEDLFGNHELMSQDSDGF